MAERNANDNMKVREIMEDPRIEEAYSGADRKAQQRLLRAAECLKDETEPARCLLSILGVLIYEEPIRVFLSYKMDDEGGAAHDSSSGLIIEPETAAEGVAEQLSLVTDKRVEVRYAGEFMGGGDEMQGKIREEIMRAHWFILLLPDPSTNWDWCIYEYGMFRGKMLSTRINRSFCLHHHLNHAPDQVTDFLTVEARPNSFRSIKSKLLNKICNENDFFPGMGQLRRLPSAALDEPAKEINMAVLPPDPIPLTKRFSPFARIQLDLPTTRADRKRLSLDDIEERMDAARFVHFSEKDTGTNEELTKMFDWGGQPDTWGELVSNVIGADPDTRWHNELVEEVSKAARGRRMGSVQATLTTADSSKTSYRPLLYAMNEFPSGEIESFLITFIKDFAAAHVSGVADDMLEDYPNEGYVTLVTFLRLSYRFRWEVVERYKDISDPEDVVALLDAYQRVIQESSSRGEGTLEDLAPIFKSIGRDGDVERLYHVFAKARTRLEGEMRKKKPNLKTIRAILTEFAPANQEYLALSSSLFARMNKKLLDLMVEETAA